MKQNLLFLAVVIAITGVITAAFSRQSNESLDLLRSPPQTVDLQPVPADPFTADALPTSEGVTPQTGDYVTANPGAATSPTAVSPAPVTVPPSIKNTGYQPKQFQAAVHPSNYGERYARDAAGQPAKNDWIIVLHETVGSGTSAINHFQTPHPEDGDQASYHALIWLDGTIIYLVPPEKRAFGAGNSVFEGDRGPETVKTNPGLPPSVNNFAYHISLETPPNGRESKEPTHSGYTQAQYQSLAWLVARTGVPGNRITTHRNVDRSGNRGDPRSFDVATFQSMLSLYR
ncbi:MAG: peptidoglycan recognition family protein [Thermosynechococcaceae cyanobacterium]